MTEEALWRYIETTPGQSAPLCEWERTLGSWSGFGAFKRSFLQLTDNHAASVPCATECGAGCPRRVVEEQPGAFVAVCAERVEVPYAVPRKDLLVYRLKDSAICSTLASILGLTGSVDKITGLPRTWRIGDYVPEAGFAYPVFLHLPDLEDDMDNTIRALCIRQREFILLLPTRDRVSTEATAVLKQNGSVLAILAEELLHGNNGHWKLKRPVMQIAAQLHADIPEPNSGGTVHFATPAGSTWHQLSMRFVYGDSHSVSVRLGAIAGQYTCADMGMVSKHNGKPTKQWVVLQALARHRGSITWKDSEADRTFQKQKQELSKRLREFFRIEGDPIVWDKRDHCYHCLFTILPEDDDA